MGRARTRLIRVPVSLSQPLRERPLLLLMPISHSLELRRQGVLWRAFLGLATGSNLRGYARPDQGGLGGILFGREFVQLRVVHAPPDIRQQGSKHLRPRRRRELRLRYCLSDSTKRLCARLGGSPQALHIASTELFTAPADGLLYSGVRGHVTVDCLPADYELACHGSETHRAFTVTQFFEKPSLGAGLEG